MAVEVVVMAEEVNGEGQLGTAMVVVASVVVELVTEERKVASMEELVVEMRAVASMEAVKVAAMVVGKWGAAAAEPAAAAKEGSAGEVAVLEEEVSIPMTPAAGASALSLVTYPPESAWAPTGFAPQVPGLRA